ncbi:MAG: serine/threonine protein kinase, partial [Sandaracinaceae bacterium]|nr:serine/threonine protein kinase [Sandaracinaceae bacterium]
MSVSMRICPQCGTRFSEPVSFCPHDGTPTTELNEEPPKDPYLGRVIDGRYRVESVLGEGGMGVVYQIAHAVLGKRMALKVLRGDMARDSEVVQRFIQEAQSATQIGHQNIIDISDFGKMPDGSAYFVMEYLDGLSLTQLISRGGSIPTQKALHIIRQIASALEAAHERGIVHRDMKPDNIYVVKQGADDSFVKVLDFGIAKVGGASSKLTKTGMIFGTPHYMSPEQAAGQTVDRRTDIYALGVIMYEMFVGRVPFEGDTFMGILSKHMFQDPIPPSQAKGVGLGAIEDVILKALAKKVEARYQTMSELIADLDKVQAGGSVSIGRGGISPPGNLADVLEPPSRTELRLGRAPQAAPADDVAPPVKPRAPLVIGALLVLALLFVGVGAGVFFGVAGGSVAQLEAMAGIAPITSVPTTTTVPPGTATPPGTTTPPGSTTPPGTTVPPGTATPPGTTVPPGTATPPGTTPLGALPPTTSTDPA